MDRCRSEKNSPLTYNESCIFKPIKATLNALRPLGFPMKIHYITENSEENPEAGMRSSLTARFTLSKSLICANVALLLTLVGYPGAMILLAMRFEETVAGKDDSGNDDYDGQAVAAAANAAVEDQENKGGGSAALKVTDVVSSALLLALTLASNLAILLCIGRRVLEDLRHLAAVMASAASRLQLPAESVRHCFRDSRHRIGILYALFAFTSVGTVLHVVAALESLLAAPPSPQFHTLKWPLGALSTTLLTLTHYTVVQASTDLLIFYTVQCLAVMVETFRDRLLEEREEEDDDEAFEEEQQRFFHVVQVGGMTRRPKSKRINNWLDVGFSLRDAICYTNSAFSRFIVVMFLTSGAFATIGFFTAVVGASLLLSQSGASPMNSEGDNDSGGGSALYIQAMAAMVSLFLGVASMLRLYYMTAVGQNMRGAVRRARSELERLKFRQKRLLDDRMRFKAEHLRNEFWEYGTLKPMSYFKIKNSVFLSISGVIFMYLIVMMQFRISE